MNLVGSIYNCPHQRRRFWLGKIGTRYHAIQRLFEEHPSILAVLYCGNVSDMLMISYNGPDVASAGKLCLFAYYRNCDHTYVICMHGA